MANMAVISSALILVSAAVARGHAQLPSAGAVSVSWDNSKPRLDTHGKIMDAHDGNILGPIGGLYYLYGVSLSLSLWPAAGWLAGSLTLALSL